MVKARNGAGVKIADKFTSKEQSMSKEENKNISENEKTENVTQENTEKVSQETNGQEQKEFAKQAKIIMEEAEKAKIKENTLCLLEKTRAKLTEIGFQKLFWGLSGAFMFYIFVSLWTVSVLSSNSQSYQKDVKIAIAENKIATEMLNHKINLLINNQGNVPADLNNINNGKILKTLNVQDKGLEIIFIDKNGNNKLVKYELTKDSDGAVYLNSIVK